MSGVLSAFLTVCFGFNLPSSLPSLSVTVTVPSLPTSTFASAGNFGFASLTAFSTAFFSSSVNLDGSFTSTGFSGAFNAALTVSSGFNFPSSLPSLSFTVTVPSLPTSTVAPSGKFGFAFLTASSTAFFSGSVRLDGSATLTGSAGATTAASSAFLTVLSGVNFPSSLPSLSFTVTVPSLPTSTVAPSGKFGFAFLTASSTAFFSGSVRLDGSATLTGSAGATTAASSAFLTVLSGVNFPSSLPSLSFTVTVPSLPTSTVAPSGKFGFAFLTASSTAFFSGSVRLDGSATLTGSAGATTAASSAFLTVLSGVNFPSSLPSLSFTVTVPSLPTSTVAPSGKFGFAFLTASSTAFFSGSVRLDGSATLTGSAGATTAASSAFLTVLSGVNFPSSLPSLSFTVTVPSLPTSTVAPSGKFGFAFLTASSTAFFSGSVRLDGSATLTGSAGATTAASSAFLTVLSGVNFPSSLPSLSFTVTVPSLPTSTVAPSGKFGFAFLTASSTAFFSGSVRLDGSATLTGSAGATTAASSAFLTVLSGVNFPSSLPSLSFTVTVPSFPTVTFASAGKSLFASLTAFSTSFFSSSVNLDGSFTETGVGAFNSAPGVAGSSVPAFLTAWLAGIVAAGLPSYVG